MVNLFGAKKHIRGFLMVPMLVGEGKLKGMEDKFI